MFKRNNTLLGVIKKEEIQKKIGHSLYGAREKGTMREVWRIHQLWARCAVLEVILNTLQNKVCHE